MKLKTEKHKGNQQNQNAVLEKINKTDKLPARLTKEREREHANQYYQEYNRVYHYRLYRHQKGNKGI